MSADRFRSPELLRVAAGQSCTLRLPGCTGGPCVSAHSNQAKHGKGRSVKADDCFIAHACDRCHREIDQGKNLTRAEKFEAKPQTGGDDLVLVAKYGEPNAPKEERVTFRKVGTVVQAIRAGEAGAAIVTTADFDRAFGNLKDLGGIK